MKVCGKCKFWEFLRTEVHMQYIGRCALDRSETDGSQTCHAFEEDDRG